MRKVHEDCDRRVSARRMPSSTSTFVRIDVPVSMKEQCSQPAFLHVSTNDADRLLAQRSALSAPTDFQSKRRPAVRSTPPSAYTNAITQGRRSCSRHTNQSRAAPPPKLYHHTS